jgi:nitrogen fixation NifU-like protein
MAYGPKIIDHYEKPRNVGTFGTQKEIKERKDVGVGLVGAPECGDVMQLQIKVDDEPARSRTPSSSASAAAAPSPPRRSPPSGSRADA